MGFPMALLLALPAAASGLWLMRRRAGGTGDLPGDWGQIVAPAMRPLMAGELIPGVRFGAVLLLAIWITVVLALARPGLDTDSRPAFSNFAGRVIALDLGAGADIHAQRLAVTRLVEASPQVPTALVVGTADAFDVVPLTTDKAFIDRYLNVIRPDVVPISGRSLRIAIAHGEAILSRAGIVVGQLVLMTGGSPPERQPEANARWSRAIMVDDGIRRQWEAYADQSGARLISLAGLDVVVDDLDRAIEQTLRDSNRDGRVELAPYLVGAAMLLWLGLFRRRRAA
jgi:hypothetical protein